MTGKGRSDSVAGAVVFAAVGLLGSLVAGVGNRGEPLPTRAAEGAPPVALIASALGGLRIPAGDLAWLRSVLAWEKRRTGEYLAAIEIVHWLRPEALHYWIEGARTVAYDLPVWDPDRAATFPALALNRIGRALKMYPQNGYLLATGGEILFRAADQPGPAADWLRRAALSPEGIPFHARFAVYLDLESGESLRARDTAREALERFGDWPDPEELRWLREVAQADPEESSDSGSRSSGQRPGRHSP